MIEAYYGRTKAYDAALASGREALAGALARNVYNAEAAGPGALALADYVLRAARAAESAPGEALLAGRIEFPPVAWAPATVAGGR
jgi:cytochrome b pre-mRNA-processing protein 3